MAGRQREVVWTAQARTMLDEAVTYIAEDSTAAALRLLNQTLDAAGSLQNFSERSRVVPEVDRPDIREVFVQRYRLIYQVRQNQIYVLAFLHGARDLAKWRRDAPRASN